VVLDFDGVLTDNRVWVDGEGRETVAADRGDGWGIARLVESGIPVVVLSSETDAVVAARCRKLGIPAIQGVREKAAALTSLLRERGLERDRVVYVGNDANDLPCFPLVGCAVVPCDAHPIARKAADWVLRRGGGRGAVRELCDILLERKAKRGDHA
jgi:N-acylneuraminate cytidylyltransferase